MLGCSAQAQQDTRAREVFGPFDGEWRGVFKMYKQDGTFIDSLVVHQKYWWDGEVQKGVFSDTFSDGRVEMSDAQNFVRNDTLFCVVKKRSGEETTHFGTYDAGRLTWWRKIPASNLQESFKEYVAVINGKRTYFIDGVGVYGEGEHQNIMLFEGRYVAQE